MNLQIRKLNFQLQLIYRFPVESRAIFNTFSDRNLILRRLKLKPAVYVAKVNLVLSKSQQTKINEGWKFKKKKKTYPELQVVADALLLSEKKKKQIVLNWYVETWGSPILTWKIFN